MAVFMGACVRYINLSALDHKHLEKEWRAVSDAHENDFCLSISSSDKQDIMNESYRDMASLPITFSLLLPCRASQNLDDEQQCFICRCMKFFCSC